MADIEDVARWFSGRSVGWPFAVLALCVLTYATVGVDGTFGLLGVPGHVLVLAYENVASPLVAAGVLGPTDQPIGLAVFCYLLALLVGGFCRAFASAWRRRKALLYPDAYGHY